MPFGAALLDDARVRFRLWAPGAKEVAVSLGTDASQLDLTMAAEQDGWFGLKTERAAAGTLYRFRIDGGSLVPDPASRAQPEDVHGPSRVVDPNAFVWEDAAWTGRPWEEAVFYELHVGTFTPEGTFAAAIPHLDRLAALGVTALELMPVADFPGTRNWGYDGVYSFAPDSSYGSPEELKSLVQAAHARGLMVFMDVVYNHFGPEGNYLHSYAPQFFTDRHQTPWGDGINYDGELSNWVRQFVIHNALYWLEEYRMDGLRLDAVHAIADDSRTDILVELAERVRTGVGRERHIHLVLENDDNAARYLQRRSDGGPRWYDAQWNDDIHHALHVLLTGERVGYYGGYSDAPARHLARCLESGFAYQGERSEFHGEPRGEPSGHLPPAAFVGFIQNHDQIGNRAFGERISRLAPPQAIRAATALLLLAPAPPLLFMGQEVGSQRLFPFFCDFGDELARLVTEGRRREFERFPEFADPESRKQIPDPNALATFQEAILHPEDWASDEGRSWWDYHRSLLALRHQEIVPRLSGMDNIDSHAEQVGHTGVSARWRLADGSVLQLAVNLGAEPQSGFPRPDGRRLFACPEAAAEALDSGTLPEWSAVCHLRTPA